MNRSSARRWVWLLPLLAAVASCELFPPRKPATPTTQPAAGPSAAELERQRQLTLLLEKIEAIEGRLASDRTETPPPESPAVDDLPRPTPRLRVATRPDTGDVRTGANASASLQPGTGDPETAVRTALPEKVTLKSLIAALEARSQAEPKDLTLKRHLRVLYLLVGRDEDALEVIDGAPETEQAFWRQMIWALVNYTDRTHGLSESERAGETIRALDEARRLLTKQAPLEIRNLTFCTRISGFGSVEAVNGEQFRPKPGELVLLYCELDGFTVTRAEGQDVHVTVVRQELELLTARGDSVKTWDFGRVEDRCLSPRRDFYFFSKFNLPDRLLPGQYVLKVTMTDCQGEKVAEETLTITVR